MTRKGKNKKQKEFIFNDQYHVKWRRFDKSTGFWINEEDYCVKVPLVGDNATKEKQLHGEAIEIIKNKYKGQLIEIVSCSYC
jgi:hypothetical protein